MNLDQATLLKLVIFGGLVAFILLLMSFQFIFAVVVLIVVGISYIFLKQSSSS